MAFNRTGKPGATMATAAKPVGRPRDPAVIARDEGIYDLLAAGPHSRSALATATGLDRDAVYLSCSRLHKQGRIRQCNEGGAIVWAVNDGTPCA
jgi:hypothetical protein